MSKLETIYVPIVQVIVKPIQNANKVAIEKTHRTVRCPIYMVECFRKQWGHTAEIDVEPIKDANDLWKVPQMPGRSVEASELERVKRFFPKGLFDSVYRDREFYAEFQKVATRDNKHLVDMEARDELNRDAAVKRATKAVMQAAGDAEAQAKRKGRKPVTVPQDDE